jgi:hypothetical protein
VPKFIADVEGSGFECANRRFEFHKRRQLFIRMDNETLSIVTMRISNPDRSPGRIHG